MYGAAIKDLSASEKHQMSVAVNGAVRRIFGFCLWQSIRLKRKFYRLKPIEVMFENAKRQFHTALTNHRNGILRFLSTLGFRVVFV